MYTTYPIHVTNHTGKLEGIQSVNTSCLLNPFCAERAKDPDSICHACYAEKLLSYRQSLEEHLEANTRILTTVLLSDEEAALVPITTLFARVESFGDVANVTQARNYLRIARNHAFQHFGIWSKNPAFYDQAVELDGKPVNVSLVYSSPYTDVQADPNLPVLRHFDHIFTVFSPKVYDAMAAQAAQEKPENLHFCAGKSCMQCLGMLPPRRPKIHRGTQAIITLLPGPDCFRTRRIQAPGRRQEIPRKAPGNPQEGARIQAPGTCPGRRQEDARKAPGSMPTQHQHPPTQKVRYTP